ncbi:penicillin-binding protein 2 [Eubacteriales bacterium mix99]
MKHIKRNVRSSLFALLGLFLILTGYYFYNLFVYSDRWFSDPNNTRIKVDMDNPSILPGNLQDRNQNVLVETKSTIRKDGKTTYYRSYRDNCRYAAHVIGSKRYGIGAEALYIRYLLGYNNNLFERIYQKAFLDQEVGNNVILTIDMQLQKYINEVMGSRKGSVVLMDPRSGEILAMVSLPSFNPAQETEEPGEESLLNKASYGRYPPGSIMKVVTAAAALESGKDISRDTLDCKGSTDIGGITINCYGQEAHGMVDLPRAMEVSCNAYFANLSLDMGWKQLRETGEKFGFNKNFLFSDIKTVKSQLPLTRDTSRKELAWSGVGQGKVLVSPLHVALIASSVANGGEVPDPKLIHGIQTRNGNIRYLPSHGTLSTPVSPETAKKLTDMMVQVVENGTGRNARTTGMIIAGKTGTAETKEDQSPHSWFMGFAPADNPTLAIAVVLENAGTGGAKAATVAGKILRKAIRLGY